MQKLKRQKLSKELIPTQEVKQLRYEELMIVSLAQKMDPHYLVPQALLRTGWAMKHKNQVIPIPDETIAQIRASPTDTLGWFKEELRAAWKNLFPITPTSLKTGDLALEHPTWGSTPN